MFLSQKTEGLRNWLVSIGSPLPGSFRTYAIVALILLLASLKLKVIYYTHPWDGFAVTLMGWGTLLAGKLDLFIAYLSSFVLCGLLILRIFNFGASYPVLSIAIVVIALPALLPHSIPNIENSTTAAPDPFWAMSGAYVWITAYIFNLASQIKG